MTALAACTTETYVSAYASQCVAAIDIFFRADSHQSEFCWVTGRAVIV